VRNAKRVLVVKPIRKILLGDSSIDMLLQEIVFKDLIGFVWLQVRFISGLLAKRSHKGWSICSPAKRLLASQERFFSM
jgi:hypothetical protein